MFRYHDSRWINQKESVLTHADTIRMILPSLMESMTAYIKNLSSHHAKLARDTFCSAMENSINGIISSYKRLGTVEPSHNGEFLTKMDEIFSIIDHNPKQIDLKQLEQLTSWILKHSLAIAKSSSENEEEEITITCQKILTEFNKTKKEATGDYQVKSLTHFQSLGNIFELLEQNVNGALLKLCISCLPQVSYPLDNLLTFVLNSDIEPDQRLSDDLSSCILSLDNHTDNIFQLCHFTIFCTTDAEKAQKIKSLAKVLELLETELVPCILQLYFNPTSSGAKSSVKIIRSLWKSLLDELSTIILSIVDPTAYSIIVLQEMTNTIKKLINELYTQDKNVLQHLITQLLAMAESGVDLAWREMGDQSTPVQPLADTHPLVITERSIWEVRAAYKLVMTSIEDLSLHQSLQKRIRILNTSFSQIVQLLTEKQESKIDSSNILGSLVENNHSQKQSLISISTNFISFRSKKNLDKTAALACSLRQDMYKLTVDLTPFTPLDAVPRRPTLTRKPSKVTVNGCILETPVKRNGSRAVRRSSARLSLVISELSSLSHELSVCLEADNLEDNQDELLRPPSKEGSDSLQSMKSVNTNKENVGKKLNKSTQNNSLRRAAFKNLTNRVVLTSSKINL